jgi:hypothetical protein
MPSEPDGGTGATAAGEPALEPAKGGWRLWFTAVGALVLLPLWIAESCAGSEDDDPATTALEQRDERDYTPNRPHRVETAAPPSSPSAATGAVADAVFLATLDEYGVEYTSAQSAAGYGLAICLEIDLGGTPLEVMSGLQSEAGWPPSTAGAVVGAAVAVYCPQHGDLL